MRSLFVLQIFLANLLFAFSPVAAQVMQGYDNRGNRVTIYPPSYQGGPTQWQDNRGTNTIVTPPSYDGGPTNWSNNRGQSGTFYGGPSTSPAPLPGMLPQTPNTSNCPFNQWAQPCR